MYVMSSSCLPYLHTHTHAHTHSQFSDSESAEKAMANLNGLEIAGRAIKVNHVTEREYSSMESLDGDDTDIGVGMTPQSRVALMAKLAEGHNAGE